jgi:hypothetical protein
MITKTRIAVIAALLVGAASAALADNSQFDVNIYRPTVQDHSLGAFAQQLPVQPRITSRDALRARAQERAPERARSFDNGVCIPQYDSAGVQKAPYCHHYTTSGN